MAYWLRNSCFLPRAPPEPNFEILHNPSYILGTKGGIPAKSSTRGWGMGSVWLNMILDRSISDAKTVPQTNLRLA
jgi:hypothetical protein